MGLADGSSQPADADPIASHHRVLHAAVDVSKCHMHGFCVFGAQLKSIAHFNAAGNGDGRLSAVRADAALLNFGKIMEYGALYIPFHVKSRVMSVGLVGAAAELVPSFQRAVKQNGEITL